jgi:hypothetical protein
MRCERFETRLNEVLDARQPLSSASDLEEHKRECGRCRELARAYEAVLAGLVEADVPSQPVSLTSRIVAQLHRPRILRFPKRQTLLVSAAAAVLLAAVALPWMWTGMGGRRAMNDNPPQIADAGPSPQSHDLARPVQQPVEHEDTHAVSPSSAPTALLDLNQLKAQGLMSALPGKNLAHDVADGLEPVTKPTVGAISGFLQLWGVGDEGRRS